MLNSYLREKVQDQVFFEIYAVNFINVLRARFSYEIFGAKNDEAGFWVWNCFSLVTFWRKKIFRTKNARVKRWWNWLREPSPPWLT